MAAKWGLVTAARPDSQDICFLPAPKRDAVTRAYLGAKNKPGPIRLAPGGEVVGEHRGLALYTLGQRRGLRVSGGERLYVVATDADRNEVWIGREQLLMARFMLVHTVNWLAPPPQKPLQAEVRIRYRAPGAAATIHPEGERVRVEFAQPQRTITPGQAAVFYQDDLVLGGGTILAALPTPSEGSVTLP